MFHSQHNLFFTRNSDGSVTITKTDETGKVIAFQQTLDQGTWVSVVLSMSAFGERPGDFYFYMDHHQGHKDVFASEVTA